MAVFARTKLVMYDNCFPEDPAEFELKYVGPNPIAVYQRMYELMKTVWRAGDKDIQEDQYNYGKSDVEKVKVRWHLHRDIDRFSYFWVRFDLSASGNEKSGNAYIRIKPILMTEYPQDTVWQRSLLYEMLRTFWHRAFYHNKRREYMDNCRDITSFFLKKMKEYFKYLAEEAEKS